jgi:hypothetical protein
MHEIKNHENPSAINKIPSKTSKPYKCFLKNPTKPRQNTRQILTVPRLAIKCCFCDFLKMFKLILLALILCSHSVRCWDTEELEIYDLVEELKEESFYKVLGVLEVSFFFASLLGIPLDFWSFRMPHYLR